MQGFTAYTTRSAAEVLAVQTVQVTEGLSDRAVATRQKTFGLNQLNSREQKAWRLFARQFHSAFVYLLLSAGAIAWMLGERIDGSVIFVFVLANAVISFCQEFRSEQTVRLLKKFIGAKARVRRGGEVVAVDQKELVPGDIVLCEAGDMFPADVRLVRVNNLIVDETVLTGESLPVTKTVDACITEAKELFQATNIGFCGTIVVGGSGEGVVIGTGSSTVMGGIAKLTSETERVSGFSKEMNTFSGFVLKVILVTLLVLFVGNLIAKHGKADVIDLLIFSIALAVSVVPEALPVVTTFSLSHGALKLAKKKVVVKRLSAIEDLGSIDVLCTDKTGTLTENTLAVGEVVGPEVGQVLYYGALGAGASLRTNVREVNSFDVALSARLSQKEMQEVHTAEFLSEIPFDPNRRFNSVLVATKEKQVLIMRGAPESVMAACDHITSAELQSFNDWIALEGNKGRRVLAVAKKDWANQAYTLADEHAGFALIGIVSFVDPIKPSTKAAITQAKQLGLTVKIITGDSKEVAGLVAFEVGLISDPANVMTGEAFERLDEEQRRDAVETFNVFARVSPKQKHEIIQLLEGKHQVGFLGEGINDAPALKAANVAIVVQSASDIAREAADIVLLEQSLSVIVEGVTEGRIVFANTLKYIKATLASNFGNFYAVVAATFFIEYLPMLPLQILLLNLLTDFPMISIATDTTDPAELERPETYHIKDIALFMTIIGVVSTVFDLIFFAVFRSSGQVGLQTAWFMGSVLTELAFLFSIRSKLPFWRATRPAPILFVFSGLAALVAFVLPFTRFGARLFHFAPPTFPTIGLILGIVAAYFVSTESVKLLYYRFIGRTKVV